MKPRERLARALSEVIGLTVLPGRLYGARGWYKHRQADVMPFTGSVRLSGINIDRSIGSWQTMTACLKYGFVVYDEHADRGSYSDFNVCAIDPNSGEKAGNGMGSWQPKVGITRPTNTDK